MTKKEGIREGIKKTLRGVGNYLGWEEDATEAVLKYLHSQGVVIKVDSELPCVESGKWYYAVEPLILIGFHQYL